MTRRPRRMLNKGVLSTGSFDSGALGPLAALFHRVERPGDYELAVVCGERVLQRVHVRVTEAGFPRQVDCDLARADRGSPAERREGPLPDEIAAGPGAVLAFFVSGGRKRYSVRLREGGSCNGVRLDSARTTAGGDVFTVTPAREGKLVATDGGVGRMEIVVQAPDPKAMGRPPAMVRLGGSGFDTKAVEISAGQSIAFACESPAHLRVVPPEGVEA